MAFVPSNDGRIGIWDPPQHIVTAPAYEPVAENVPSLFLAGGMHLCPDWQQEVIEALKDSRWIIFNPRRKEFPTDDPDEAEIQNRWEHDHLRRATAILFWFPSETLCPMALYQLGAWTVTDKPIFLGIHPDYRRRLDIEIQTELARPTHAERVREHLNRPPTPIVYGLKQLTDIVRTSFHNHAITLRSSNV